MNSQVTARETHCSARYLVSLRMDSQVTALDPHSNGGLVQSTGRARCGLEIVQRVFFEAIFEVFLYDDFELLVNLVLFLSF
jgi:hypothetical protein